MLRQISIANRARRSAPAAVLLVAALAACGESGFLPPGEGTAPRITAFSASPDIVAEGDTLELTITASGQRDVNRIHVSFLGALVRDTILNVSTPARQIDETFRILIPFSTGPGSLLFMDASAIDVADIQGEVASDTVELLDRTDPTVAATVSPTDVGSGEILNIDVQAADNRGLAFVGFTGTNDAGWDTLVVDTLAEPALSYTNRFELMAPDLPVGQLSIQVFAVDVTSLIGEAPARTVDLSDKSGPLFTRFETAPDSTVPLGQGIEVSVDVEDPSGIRRLTFLGRAARGDTLLGTDIIVDRFPPFTIDFPRPGQDELPTEVTRAPIIITADETTSEPVTVIVIAEDRFGNLTEVRKEMFIGGPNVVLEFPAEDVAFGVGQEFEVRVLIADALGIDSARVILSGGVEQRLALPLPPRTDTPFVAVQTIVLPAVESSFSIQARAWNTAQVGGQSRTHAVEVLEAPPDDTQAPIVTLQAVALVPAASLPRVERKDRIRILVRARDIGPAGLSRIGFKAVAVRGETEHVITQDVTFAASKSLEQLDFVVPLDSLYTLFGITGDAARDALLPEDIVLRIHAFAADAADPANFACSVGIDEQRPCTPSAYSATEFFEAADTAGFVLRITAVRGNTVLLDNSEALIADLAVDTLNDRLFLSNITENLVEMLDLTADLNQAQFLSPVQVGSRPWGIFIGERIVSSDDEAFLGGLVPVGSIAPTLIVGNSGGTNMSLVHLDADASNVQEVAVVRLLTPNAVLFEVKENTDEFNNTRFTRTHLDFSDRPQFLAQDSLLRVVYSTVPTAAANTSTIRVVHMDPVPTESDDQPEVLFLVSGDMVDPSNETSIVLANVDSIRFTAVSGANDLIRIFTHEPGYPQNVIASAALEQVSDAVDDVIAQIDAAMAARGVPELASTFYPFSQRGTWLLSQVGLSDTTFIAASTDRGRIAIGEGAKSPTGRIILWSAEAVPGFSTDNQIADLIHNASERILGIGLNIDGSMGVARGLESTFFFTSDLRLQGLFQQPVPGGAGAAFHPSHSSPFDGGQNDPSVSGFAFAGSSTRSIDVVNTFHFNRVEEVFIRDNIVGPLRTGPPLAADNAGLTCPADDDCIVAKLYGITDVGGVVIVNVRRRDLN